MHQRQTVTSPTLSTWQSNILRPSGASDRQVNAYNTTSALYTGCFLHPAMDSGTMALGAVALMVESAPRRIVHK